MDSATTYEELKALIGRAYPDMSKQLQRIARFALEQPNDLALGTVATVAEATEVQPSAMIRFANALGFGGFSEMQQVFRGHLLERSDSYRERIDQMRRKQLNGERAPAGVLHQLVGESVAELGHLEEAIAQSDLKAAVKLMASAPRIHVLAQRRAFPVAGYLAYALSQLELRTHLLDGTGGMLRESLRSIAPGDVLIAASFRSYSPEVIAAGGGRQAGRAGDCHHRWPALAAQGACQGLPRTGRRFVQTLPLAGRAAVPGASAGGQHRPSTGRAGRGESQTQKRQQGCCQAARKGAV
jgi:DNA-binding MurR/RpiR family transcriptional regulator